MPSLRQSVEDHPAFYIGTIAVICFGAGFGACLAVNSAAGGRFMWFNINAPGKSQSENAIAEQVESIRISHARRVDELQQRILAAETEATSLGWSSETRLGHMESAQRLQRQLAEENSSFLQQIQALMHVSNAPTEKALSSSEPSSEVISPKTTVEPRNTQLQPQPQSLPNDPPEETRQEYLRRANSRLEEVTSGPERNVDSP